MKINILTEMIGLDSEENKVYWVMGNAILNGLNYPDYNYLTETKEWAKGKDYFPDLSWEKFLLVARKYTFWENFEKLLNR